MFRGLCMILFGAALGCGATVIVFRWHVVQAADGWHFVETGTPMPTDCYADIRDWTPEKWAAHPELAAALIAAGKGELVMLSSATNVLDRALNRR